MGYKWLKRTRVFVSLVFLVLTAFVFIDFKEALPSGQIRAITWLQFVPSIIKFINVFSIAATGFVVVLIITLLYGRVYCSTVCPLGILQDVVSWVSRKLRIRKKVYRLSKPLNWLRYGFLGVTVLFLLFGSIFMLVLLDPFSNFGRIFSDFGKPLYIWVNNQAASVLQHFGSYALYPENFKKINPYTIVVPAIVLITTVWLSLTRGRLYCNTVCPVGTVLGLLSRFSLFRITIDKSSCNSCGSCSVVCKAGCIDIKKKEVDFSRCVGCFNCLPSCPESGIGYKISRAGAKLEKVDKEDIQSKRSFLLKTLTFVALSGGITRSALGQAENRVRQRQQERQGHGEGHGRGQGQGQRSGEGKPELRPVIKEYPVSPPGSISLSRFKDSCTACHLCVSECPTEVLQPAFLEYGIFGMMQPRMDFHKSFCNFNCTRCGEVCPTGAIMPLTQEEKSITQIGIAYFIRRNCIVHTDKTACGSCSEHCPTQAVRMVPYRDNLTIPEVNPDICVGCGACEYACPVVPHKAIYVDGNPVHQIADKPSEEKLEYDMEEDFPF